MRRGRGGHLPRSSGGSGQLFNVADWLPPDSGAPADRPDPGYRRIDASDAAGFAAALDRLAGDRSSADPVAGLPAFGG